MSAALAFSDQEIALAELERRIACAASGLERLGIREGDVVALMLRNSPAFIEAMTCSKSARVALRLLRSVASRL